MSRLNTLVKLVKKTKCVGRGGARGGTAGRGHKGQSARSGGSVGVLFEGGQMPLSRRLPKRGFNNAVFKKYFELVNLADLERLFDAGDLVNKESLFAKGFIKARKGFLIKLLGNGTLSKKLVVEVDACSASAKDAVCKLGGEVRI
jgi:large subunit ribosomal protein L15